MTLCWNLALFFRDVKKQLQKKRNKIAYSEAVDLFCGKECNFGYQRVVVTVVLRCGGSQEAFPRPQRIEHHDQARKFRNVHGTKSHWDDEDNKFHIQRVYENRQRAGVEEKRKRINSQETDLLDNCSSL